MILHYDVLKVTPNASLIVINAAYEALCQKYNPDNYQDETKRSKAESVIKRLNVAYGVLSDTEKRKIYDESIGIPTKVDTVKLIESEKPLQDNELQKSGTIFKQVDFNKVKDNLNQSFENAKTIATEIQHSVNEKIEKIAIDTNNQGNLKSKNLTNRKKITKKQLVALNIIIVVLVIFAASFSEFNKKYEDYVNTVQQGWKNAATNKPVAIKNVNKELDVANNVDKEPNKDYVFVLRDTISKLKLDLHSIEDFKQLNSIEDVKNAGLEIINCNLCGLEEAKKFQKDVQNKKLTGFSILYKNGKKSSVIAFADGEYKFDLAWHDNGVIESRGYFINGEFSQREDWSRDGKKTSHIEVVDGRIEGFRSSWDENGQELKAYILEGVTYPILDTPSNPNNIPEIECLNATNHLKGVLKMLPNIPSYEDAQKFLKFNAPKNDVLKELREMYIDPNIYKSMSNPNARNYVLAMLNIMYVQPKLAKMSLYTWRFYYDCVKEYQK